MAKLLVRGAVSLAVVVMTALFLVPVQVTGSWATSPAPCLASHLTASASSEGSTNNIFGGVGLKNTGTHVCSLRGYATVVLTTRSGKSLPVETRHVSYHLTPGVVRSPKPVVLSGGKGSANIYLQWWNWCGADPGPLTIRVVLPSGGYVVAKLKYIGTAMVPGCLDKATKSFMDITPIQNTVP